MESIRIYFNTLSSPPPPHPSPPPKKKTMCTVKILNIGTCMSEQTVKILIRLLLRSSLIRIYTVCHSFYIFWRHYFIVKLNCFILRTTTVAGLGVPIFRVFTVVEFANSKDPIQAALNEPLQLHLNCLPTSL